MAFDDVDEVAGIEAENPSAWSMQAVLSELHYRSGHRLVAFLASDNGTTPIVGWCASRGVDQEAELLKIAVRRQYRRQGVGRQLFDTLFNNLVAADVRKLFLEVRSSNTEAICFYRNTGGEVVGMRQKYYSNPDDDALVFQFKVRECLPS